MARTVARRGRRRGLLRALIAQSPFADMKIWHWVVVLGVAGVVCLTIVLVSAPATYVDLVLRAGTGGRVRLADASGSIWNGKGRVVLVDTVTEAEMVARNETGGIPTLVGVVIPGQVGWKVDPIPLLIGRLRASVNHESMTQPVLVEGTFSRIQVTGGAMQLPSVNLSRLGSPWNTVRPTGSLALQWQAITIDSGSVTGKGSVELRDIGSALTPVHPLGAFRLEFDAQGQSAQLQMSPTAGPLRLSGSGRWTAQRGLSFTAMADVDENERMRLQAMLALIGRREGNRTIIKLGA